MDKQAFKQRMQNLKSYRENNPGKGYWDWKVEAFQNGGEVGNPSVQAIQQKQWLNDWLKSRSKQMAENIDFYSNQNVYGSSMDRMHVSPFFFQDKEENAAKIIQEQLQHANNTPIYDYREPWVSANKNIPNRKEFLKMNSGVQGAYHKKYGQPNTISISPIATDRSVILHELSHATQDKYNIQSSKIDDILKRHQKENHNYDKYYDNPDEVYSRMNQFRYDNNIRPEDIITKEQIEQWKDSSIDNEFINRYSTNTLLDLLNSVAQTWDFRGNNSNLKDDQGNYYIDPNRQLTPEDISNMRSKGAKIPEQWESLEDADISELTNTFAYNLSQDPIYFMANGGEIGDPDDEFAKAVNTKLGRTPDGRPLQQGLKPVFDQEESQFIIKHLMNCLVYNEPFDCSSLGPNKYLNE